MLVEFASSCVVDPEGLQANLEKALARGLPQCVEEPARTDKLAVVGGAPSVRHHLDELRCWPGEIWAINGAYDYLLGEDIVPHGFIGVDPLPGLAEYVQNPRKETTFYLSGLLDPSVFDALKGENVKVWFPEQDAVKWPAGLWLVGGGTTAVTRVPYLARMQGFRDMTIYGADSSFEDDRYCYGYGKYKEDSKAEILSVQVHGHGKKFKTELGLMKQVAQLGVIDMYFDGQISFKCGGLLDAYLKSDVL